MRIETVDCLDHSLSIHWGDGHHSQFDLFWLRDNCSCRLCGDRSVGRKLVSMLQMPADPQILEYQADCDQLSITWSDERHVSVYTFEWLRQHCYCETCRSLRRCRPKLWDCSLKDELPKFHYEAVMGNERTHFGLLSRLRDTGFVLVHGVPTSETGFETILARVGYLKQTNYGRICDLKVTREGRLLGDTDLPIPLHTDECYRHANPGMLAFHCLSSSGDGGGANLLADGFMLADTLRRQNRDAFDLLCRIPMSSRRFHNDEVDLRSATPVISVDYEGNLQGVRYNERSAAPLDLPADLIQPAYRALSAWLTLTTDERFQVRIHMRPGDLLLFDNQRVLHGRDRFNGKRHLLYAQLDLDEPHSRSRVLARRLGSPDLAVHTHRGT